MLTLNHLREGELGTVNKSIGCVLNYMTYISFRFAEFSYSIMETINF